MSVAARKCSFDRSQSYGPTNATEAPTPLPAGRPLRIVIVHWKDSA